jgi:hypothetical protein
VTVKIAGAEGLVRELDERLGLSSLRAEHITDGRRSTES